MTRRGGIYARISKADKKVPKTQIQVSICQTLADEDEVHVSSEHIFIDDGIAASGKGIDDTTLQNRPQAQRCLAAMRAGEFDVLYAVEGERLARTYLDGLEFIRASEQGKITWHLDTDGILDPRTPAGEETAVGIFASGRREGRVRTARQKRRYDRERASGMPLWGPRPFGWEEDRITLRPSEADIIREAVTDYLAGTRSMLRIAKDWTAAGVMTDGMQRERRGRDGIIRPASKTWTATLVRQVVQRERNAGILMHDGARMPNSQIEPIITKEQLDEIKARVKTGTPVGARAQSLLGGVIKCECGAPMHATMTYSQRKGGPRHEYRVYKCSRTIYDKTRKHAAIAQNIVDELFIGFILLDLYNGSLTSPESDDTSAALQGIGQRLTANEEAMAHIGGIIMDVSLTSLHAKAKGELKVLDAQRAELIDERDVLLSRAEHSGGLEAFMAEWRETTRLGFKDADEAADWEARLWEAWNSVSIERRQGLIKARYRPTVKVGGRGIERISVNPIDLSAFGQPVEVEDDDE